MQALLGPPPAGQGCWGDWLSKCAEQAVKTLFQALATVVHEGSNETQLFIVAALELLAERNNENQYVPPVA